MGLWQATIDLTFSIGSGHGTNTFVIRTTGPDDGTEAGTAVGWLQTFYTSLAGLFPSTSSAAYSGELREVGVVSPTYLSAGDAWSVPGSATAGQYGPAPAMACVGWRTNLATRSGHGRTFLGPLSNIMFQTDGTLTSDALSGIRTAASALVASSTGETGASLVVWSPKTSTGNDITGTATRDIVAVLRSRRG